MKHVDLDTVEPSVLDLTIDPDFAIICVRMPIYELDITHAEDYLELKYRRMPHGVEKQLFLSPSLVRKLLSSEAFLASLPPVNPQEVPGVGHLGDIKCFQIAASKLRRFDEEGQWKPYFAKAKPSSKPPQ